MKSRKRTFLFVAVIFIVVLAALGLTFTLSSQYSQSQSDDCTTPLPLNPNFWKFNNLVSRSTIGQNHKITTISEDEIIPFSLHDKQLFASKLQELGFWNEKGVLSTESKPRRYVQPQHICIITTSQVQPYGQYIDEKSKEVIQSSSTIFDDSSSTFKVYLYFNPKYFIESVNKETFGYTLTYQLMSTLFKVSHPRTRESEDLSERYNGKDEFLSTFRFDSSSAERNSVFEVHNLNWNSSQ